MSLRLLLAFVVGTGLVLLSGCCCRERWACNRPLLQRPVLRPACDPCCTPCCDPCR